jgi:hypothetical protein
MYISYLDYPSLPIGLEQDILNTVKSNSNFKENNLLVNADQTTLDLIGKVEYDPNNNIGYPYLEARKYFPTLVDYYFLDPSPAVKDWVHTHINKDVTINIQVMTNGTHVPPHIDEVRTYAINYLISAGGNATTDFYEPKVKFENVSVTAQTAIPYEKLDLKESKQIAEKVWHKLSVTKIHSVENITPQLKRIALTLSLV